MIGRAVRVLACLGTLFGGTASAAGGDTAAAIAPAPLAPGVYVLQAPIETPDEHNAGATANMGFIVGERCVAAIDTGGSRRAGERLAAAIRAATPLPVCYVINTHAHPDHVLGNAAFAGGGAEFVGHARLPAALAARGALYRAGFAREIGPSAAAGSEVVPPTVSVDGTRRLDLGNRVLVLTAWPTAHTDCDLTVFDERTGTLWVSDLLFVDHLPVVDGSLKGWLAALDRLALQHPAHVVPGHGAVDPRWPDALARERVYLDAVATRVRAALRDNRSLSELLSEAATPANGPDPATAGWQLVDAFHLRNLSAVYAELEWE